MSRKKKLIILLCGVFCVGQFFYFRRPITLGKLTKQTIYLAILNSFHIKDTHAEAQFMLIDDDSGPGIFKIREICERVGVKATFAVVPAFLDSIRCDSLRKWQQEGYGIALHGYNHGRWKDWSEEEVRADIDKSMAFLKDKGFDVDKVFIVVSPSFYNTFPIRSAISSKGMKMVMGASVVNPDSATFQWGRFLITKNTETNVISNLLMKAKEMNGFVIFGTHSSIESEFSAEKIEAILKMVVDYDYKQL